MESNATANELFPNPLGAISKLILFDFISTSKEVGGSPKPLMFFIVILDIITN